MAMLAQHMVEDHADLAGVLSVGSEELGRYVVGYVEIETLPNRYQTFRHRCGRSQRRPHKG